MPKLPGQTLEFLGLDRGSGFTLLGLGQSGGVLVLIVFELRRQIAQLLYFGRCRIPLGSQLIQGRLLFLANLLTQSLDVRVQQGIPQDLLPTV